MSSSEQSNSPEKDLLAKLDSRDHTGIGDMFKEYLKNHKPFTRKNANKKNLYARFKDFFNNSFIILDQRLTKPAEFNNPNMVVELFKVYRLCLDYVDKALHQTSKFIKYWLPPRVSFMKCLEAHGHVEEIETQGRALLMRLTPLTPPEEVCYHVIYIYMMLFKIAPKSTNEQLRCLNDWWSRATDWIRFRCHNNRRAHLALVNEVLKFASDLWENTSITDTDLKNSFICGALKEKMKHGIEGIEVYNSATTICSSVFKLGNYKYVRSIVTTIAPLPQDKDTDKAFGIEFVKVVSHCVDICKDTDVGHEFATFLTEISQQYKEVLIIIDSILRLYVVGLLADRNSKSPEPILETFDKYYQKILLKASVFSHSCNLSASDWEASYIDALLFVLYDCYTIQMETVCT